MTGRYGRAYHGPSAIQVTTAVERIELTCKLAKTRVGYEYAVLYFIRLAVQSLFGWNVSLLHEGQSFARDWSRAPQGSTSQTSTADAVMEVTSLALLCVSFLSLVTVSIDTSGVTASGSIDAWHSYGSRGMLIALAGIALWTVARFKTIPLAPTHNRAMITGGTILLGTALVFARGVVYPSENLSSRRPDTRQRELELWRVSGTHIRGGGCCLRRLAAPVTAPVQAALLVPVQP